MSEEMYSDVEQNIYFYHYLTKEYEGIGTAPLDVIKASIVGKNQYYRAGYSTFVAPPATSLNEIAIFDKESISWSIKQDFRGAQYTLDSTAVIITEIDQTIPEESTDIIPPPPKSFIKPQYVNGEWVDTQLVYKGYNVETKENVDLITKFLISNLGEEKAKSEKLIAGDGPCPDWDVFILARTVLLDDGNDFKTANNLI